MTRSQQSRCRVTVCRDCCCGSAAKHPEVDHDAQLSRLRSALRDVAEVRVSSCLDVCERSNVLVVNPSPQGRRAGGRPTWLMGVLDDEAVADVVQWVRCGGPGVGTMPLALGLQRFRRPRGTVC